MANLVKINNVFLYTTTQAGANVTAECDAARALLANANVKFSELWYNDININEQVPVLTALSTWSWGFSGSDGQRQFTTFPIVHWIEYYDDWSQKMEQSQGLSELQASDLLKNAPLVGG